MIPKTPPNIRFAYGLALESAGLQGAIENIDHLLDDGYQEKFIEYYPSPAAFNIFKERFSYTRFSVMEKLEWAFDREFLDKNPRQKQALKGYFTAVFMPAVLNPELKGDDDE